jgi:hypothetical protein
MAVAATMGLVDVHRWRVPVVKMRQDSDSIRRGQALSRSVLAEIEQRGRHPGYGLIYYQLFISKDSAYICGKAYLGGE